MASSLQQSFSTPKSLYSPAFLLVCTSALFFFSSYHLLTPVLPLYLETMGFSGTQLGILLSTFTVASMVMRPWAGKLSDSSDIKPVMTAALACFALTSVLYTLPVWNGFLFLLRTVQGVSFALFYTAATVCVIRFVPAENRGEGIGFYSNAIKMAMAIAPPLGLYLFQGTSATLAFWLSGGFSLAALGCLLLLKMPATTCPSKEDKALSVSTGLFSRSAMFPGLVMGLSSLAFGALIPYAPLLARENGVASPAVFYTVYAVMLILSRAITGKLSDVYGRAVVVLPGIFLVAISLCLIAYANTPLVFAVCAGVYGLAAGSIQPALMALTADKSDAKASGAAMATFTLLNDCGIATGTFLMGALGEWWGYPVALVCLSAGVTFGGLLFASRSARSMQALRRLIPCQLS